MPGYCWGCARLIAHGVYCWRCADAMPDHRPEHYGSYRVCRLQADGRVLTVMRSTSYSFLDRWLERKRRKVERGRIWVEQAMMPARLEKGRRTG